MSENFLPRQWLDLWESVLSVLGVHGEDLLAAWCAQDFDDFDELVDAALAREDGLTEHELGDDAAHGPHVDVRAVVRVAEDQLRRAIITRANVRNVGLTLNKLLCAAEVAQFQDVRIGVHEDVLWLDVSVADAFGVDIRN